MPKRPLLWQLPHNQPDVVHLLSSLLSSRSSHRSLWRRYQEVKLHWLLFLGLRWSCVCTWAPSWEKESVGQVTRQHFRLIKAKLSSLDLDSSHCNAIMRSFSTSLHMTWDRLQETSFSCLFKSYCRKLHTFRSVLGVTKWWAKQCGYFLNMLQWVYF
jgi:hypothetical protein